MVFSLSGRKGGRHVIFSHFPGRHGLAGLQHFRPQ